MITIIADAIFTLIFLYAFYYGLGKVILATFSEKRKVIKLDWNYIKEKKREIEREKKWKEFLNNSHFSEKFSHHSPNVK